MVQISTSLRNSAEALKARATAPSYTKKNNRFDAAVSKDMGRFKTVLTSHFKADGIKPAQLEVSRAATASSTSSYATTSASHRAALSACPTSTPCFQLTD